MPLFILKIQWGCRCNAKNGIWPGPGAAFGQFDEKAFNQFQIIVSTYN